MNKIPFIALTMSATAAVAQNCEEAFKIEPSVTSINSSAITRLTYLATLDKNRYESAKKDAALGGTVPVEGVPIKGTADYSEFNQKRENEFRKYSFNYSTDIANSFYHKGIDPEVKNMYIQCISTRKGLAATVENITDDFVSIKLSWFPPPSAGMLTNITYYKNGTKFEGNLPDSIAINGKAIATIPRNSKTDLILDINAQGYADQIFIPKNPPDVTVPESTILDKLQAGRKCNVVFNAPYSHGCVNKAGNSTIARGDPGYSIQYIGNESSGKWRATGPVCNKGKNNTAEYDGGTPKSGQLVVWGARFKVDEGGRVLDPGDSSVTGQVMCN